MLGLGLSLSKSAVASTTAWNTTVLLFSSRVTADGGTVESPSCIKTDVRFLIENPAVWNTTFNEFRTRVLADGGTIESQICITNDIKFLIQNP